LGSDAWPSGPRDNQWKFARFRRAASRHNHPAQSAGPTAESSTLEHHQGLRLLEAVRRLRIQWYLAFLHRDRTATRFPTFSESPIIDFRLDRGGHRED
jgi:hypothetical protein